MKRIQQPNDALSLCPQTHADLQHPQPSKRWGRSHRWHSVRWLAMLGIIGALLYSIRPVVADEYKVTQIGKPFAQDEITLWTRSEGQYGIAKDPAKSRVVVIKRTQLTLQSATLYDVQYGQKMQFQGVSIRALCRRYQPSAATNLALLHFSNKLVIPLPLETIYGKSGGRIFLAFAWYERLKGWSRDFPYLRRKSRIYRDIRPIEFAANKIVVTTPGHPFISSRHGAYFSPWRHTASLTGIEFVQRAAYYRQFAVSSSPLVKKGLLHFQQICQFCHGARRVGAFHGWDLVEPIPVFRYTGGPRMLHSQVIFKESDALQRGLLMPEIPSMTYAEARELWHWLKAIAEHPLKPYQLLLKSSASYAPLPRPTPPVSPTTRPVPPRR